jgi:DeoR/GlpR family transcriptional regulator of sugar metabolism
MATSQDSPSRRQKLLRLLSAKRRLSTVQLAKRFGVSEMTIRRDLRALGDSGLALRCYGGAVASRRITLEFAFDERRNRNLSEKRRIAQAAVRLIRPGQSLFLDTGTTTLEIAVLLSQADLPCRVMTPSLAAASLLWAKENVELVLLGGRARQGSPDLVGPVTEWVLEQLSADWAFMGAEGIDLARGIFAEEAEVARMETLMASNARRTVLVADSTKFGRRGAARYLALRDLDEIITDRRLGRRERRILRKAGVKTTCV